MFKVARRVNDCIDKYSSLVSGYDIYDIRDFPVDFPNEVIVVHSQGHKAFLEALGCQLLQEQRLILKSMENISHYSEADTQTLMFWCLKYRCQLVISDIKINTTAREIPFLKTNDGLAKRASDVFDPEDVILKSIFEDEPVFPVLDEHALKTATQALHSLGLKSVNNTTSEDISRTLKKLCEKSFSTAVSQRKAAALMKYLNENKHLILEKFADMEWILIDTDELYPCSIPMKNRDDRMSLVKPSVVKSLKFSDVIGSVCYLHNCSNFENLARFFSWNEKPQIEEVVKHLMILISKYTVDQKATFFKMVIEIYSFLNEYSKVGCEHMQTLKNLWRSKFKEECCIWNGHGFSPLAGVYIHQSGSDVYLPRYVKPLPEELQGMKSLFLELGCLPRMDLHTYLLILDKIKRGAERDTDKVLEGLHDSISILNKLKDDFGNDLQNTTVRQQIYCPVQTEDNKLELRNVEMCVILDANNFPGFSPCDDELEFYFIHPDVPKSTVDALNVKSARQLMLSDADAFEEWGQAEPLTRRIHVLLEEGYVDGFSIAKELLQNADDAGATKLRILYDERQNLEYRKKLISPGLADFQGPSVWVYNDAEFTDEDFQNITKLNGATKQNNAKKIGKFGLGFCAVYNLTDVPSFVSRDSFVIFDPHTSFLGTSAGGKCPGLRINFQRKHNLMIRKRMSHQFEVFNNIFDCQLTNTDHVYYEGTLFRLPLRRRGSEISNKVYNHEDTVDLLTKVVQMAPDMFLFNQSVTKLEIYHIESSSTDTVPKRVFQVEKKSFLLTPISVSSSIVCAAVEKKKSSSLETYPLKCLQKVTIESHTTNSQRLSLGDNKFQTSWIVSWATGKQSKTLQMTAALEGALPLGAVAVPEANEENQYRDFVEYCSISTKCKDNQGQYFFFLPLPIKHSFDFHINGQFSVTSDRRHFVAATKEDTNTSVSDWNECLMSDVIVEALIVLLESDRARICSHFSAWPQIENTPNEKAFLTSFYNNIISQNRSVFCVGNAKISYSRACFIDPCLRKSEPLGRLVFEVLCCVLSVGENRTLVDVPEQVYMHLKKCEKSNIRAHTITLDSFVTNYFLPNIDKFSATEQLTVTRDQLMKCILMSSLANDTVENIKQYACIPTQPQGIGILRKPDDLIDRSSRTADLFHDQDQRFPTENFLEPLVYERLDQLGMMKDNLPEDLILERANSVMVLNQTCHVCALQRCSAFLGYLESNVHMLSMFSKLKKIQFIPVMTKPDNWQFAWKGDEIAFKNKRCLKHESNEHQAAFVAPSDIYLAKDMPLLCCSSLIMCDEQIGRKFVDGFFERIGVRTASYNEQSVVCVIQQMFSLENCTKEEHVRPLYDFLNQACHDSLLKNIVKSKLQNQKVVFVDHCFVFTLHVAQSSVVHCPPFLFSLQNTTLGEEKYSTLSKTLDFKPVFDIDDLLSVLDELKHDKQECSLDHNCLNQVIHLLKCLNDLMEEAQKKEKHINRVIYVPDTLKVLRPSKELCFDEFDTLGEDDNNVNFIHSEVPMKHAKRFGVRSITQQMLSDAFAFEEWGQDEPLTRRLKVLLEEGYVDGFAVGKELFQNADDAGARKMYMLYDERQNEMLRSNLISEKLAECQGPALWVYNDALFSEDDLIAITKLNGGTKQFDTTKIGKFGLGFCSVYNLTDVPSFISGENFVMFDPHTTFLRKALPGKSPGIRLNFSKAKNLKVMGRMKHQFDVFEGVFDCQITQESPFFKGTLFRLPLRTRGYQISDKVYTKGEMVDLLRKIVEMAPNMFLFNQHISELKIFHLNDKENISNMRLMHHVVKHEAKFGPTDLQLPIMIESSYRKKEGSLQQNPIQCVQKVTISTDVFVTANMSMEGKNQSSVSNWLISWASGKDSETILISEKEKGALPLGAVAALIAEDYADAACEKRRSWPIVDMKIAPKCFFQKGHYFFYLPLPIECSFPFHINAQFSVTSDRRHLRSISEDDKDSSFGKWNEAIMSDMIVDALLQLLSCNTSSDPYCMWPLKSNGSIEHKLIESFYKTIVNNENKYCIFRVADKLTSLSNVQFLHADVRKNETFGEAIFEMLGYLMDGKIMVDIPIDIYERLLEVNEEVIMSKTVTAKDFVLKHFLPNINNIKQEHENLRDKVMAYTLTLPPDNDIEEMISCTACIPTDPDNILRAPKYLVDPNSDVCKMFLKNDGYFPTTPFIDHVYIIRLKKLGMMFNIISDDVLIERANTVASLYESCCFCASQRSICVMKYIRSHLSEIENQSALKQTLQNCRFCVVQNKPQDWEYVWHGVSSGFTQIFCEEHHNAVSPVVIACPIQMFTKESKHLVGCHSLIVDELYSLCTNTTEYLGINQLQSINETHVKLVLKQLETMVVFSGNTTTLQMQRALIDVYSFIEKACSHGGAIQEIIAEYFFSEKTILAGSVFVNPLNIFRSCHEIDCKPYIYTLKETALSANPTLCNVLQIKDSCKIDQLISILENIYIVKEGMSLSEVEFRQCVNLLNCIAHIIIKEGFIFDDILKNEGEIYVPDTKMILQPSQKLCFDDDDSIPKSDSMIYAHGDVSRNTAKAIGVRKKKLKHFEENSVDIEGMEDFYQCEPLITRLHRLIEGYPLGVELLKELLQNADDAGGTEVCFLLDYEFHADTNLLSKTMRPIQGPALCVYNNSAFTNADLIGIQRLGIGNKGDDPYQTGRYGVGFNVVYNITDTPTFLTIGEDLKTLCFFDPIAETIPGVNQNKPGKRLTNLEEYRKQNPALFSGFHEGHCFQSGKGTMFRLPLRTKPSSISSNVVTVDKVQDLLKEFGQYMTRILLFLKNITNISIVEKKLGDYKCLSSVRKTFDDDSTATLLEFSVKYGDLCKTYKESKDLVTKCQQHVSSFRITVLHEENGKSVSKQTFTIVQTLGFSQTLPALLKEDILRGSIALLPVGGGGI
ncbi:sacsin-like [Dreissena polymorpha]|uniref:sacsin-like n=1 Tax=Dreissena polymorpha TaxID=45954 RepID=UPI002264764A|nr:sacsin-like [Dreissena polymorpha]